VTRTRIAALAAFLVALIGVIWVIALKTSAVGEFTEPEEGFDSPRLAALAKELKAGDQAALDRFWGELRGKAPLLEPVADDPNSSWVTFAWRGDGRTRRVNVQGGPSSGDWANWMKRLGNTNLWYRTDRVPNESRFVYFFQVNRPLKFPPHDYKLPPLAPPQADPLNPRKASSHASLVELPGAPPQPWLQRLPGVAEGALSEHRITSKIVRDAKPGFEHERQFMIYTPPNYDPGGPACGLLVLYDGQTYDAPEMPVPGILDHLIASGKIPPLVAVFVYQTAERERELGCSEPFADFVAKELVPWVRTNYHVSPDPARAIVVGISHGGLMAIFCGFRHSEVFGNVLSMSAGIGWSPRLVEGRMEEPGTLTRRFVTAPRLPVRFYLTAGSFENWHLPYSLLGENHRFRDVLQAKGYSVQFREFSGGHDRLGWRGPFVEGMSFLTSTPGLE
jgi:enterochelin esterase-like enzyme